MNISNIEIINFRNIKSTKIETCEKINYIVGDNAQGKTNFIEAIYFGSTLKSFRTKNIKDLIYENDKISTLKFNLQIKSITNKIKIQFENEKKTLLINKKKTETNEIFKLFNVIIFHPDEINYVSGFPSYRRNLIDKSIFYINHDYLNIFKKYTKCLKQRNYCLKNNLKETEEWENQLIKYGSIIINERIKYINRINTYFKEEPFSKFNKEIYNLKYSKDFTNSIENQLKEEFKQKRYREKIVGYTLIGPHRDDINIFVNEKPANIYASQGQKKTFTILFKTSQIFDYRKIYGFSPVLILDDMNSELDFNRKNLLLENLINNSGQVFITATEFQRISMSDSTKIFRVKKGEISLAD